MSIKKFPVTKDTTITNAFRESLTTRGEDANMGLSDSLETFFIYGQTLDPEANAALKKEEARIVLYPELQNIWDYYTDFPENTSFVLRLFNAPHPFTLPRNFSLSLYSSVGAWDEGQGLDMESYSDIGTPNWNNRSVSSQWDSPGAVDKTNQASLIATQNFDTGEEDISMDITSWVNTNWNGDPDIFFVIAFPESLTDDSQTTSFYTKKFFSRSSEFFFKRPVIEARNNSHIRDSRGRFFSKNRTSSENQQKVMIYNKVYGSLKDFSLPANEEVYVRIYTDENRTALATLDPTSDFIEAVRVSEGIYSLETSIDESVSYVYDRWYVAPEGDSDPSMWEVVSEGKIKIEKRLSSESLDTTDYVVNIKNIKSSYLASESPIFRVYTRLKDWSPTIYKVASSDIESLSIDKMYYKIVRTIDDAVVIDYGIGTSDGNNEHTLASCDSSGNYFSFDMSNLEPGYMYGIKLAIQKGTPGSLDYEFSEQPEIFKFRVD